MTDYNIEIRPMTTRDFEAFYKSAPVKSGIGYMYYLDGKPVGGVFGSMECGFTMLCSDLHESLPALPKMTKFKWAKKMLEKFVDLPYPLYATSEKSGKFLEKLGFVFYGEKSGHSYYIYAGTQ